MNKNTTDITLSAYFNDIVIGYYEDEALVKQFGRQLGFDVDKKKVQITTPLKNVGTMDVAIKLHTKVTAQLKVNVVGM